VDWNVVVEYVAVMVPKDLIEREGLTYVVPKRKKNRTRNITINYLRTKKNNTSNIYSKYNSKFNNEKYVQQAGAELCEAQFKLRLPKPA
jgi:RNA polymerase-interacting CarD/CdnL/TRCF family regulator